MKIKKIICLLLVAIIMFFMFNISSYAVTLPSLRITSNNYAVGDKMNRENINEIQIGQTLQLYAVIGYGNDISINNNLDDLGWFIEEANLSGVNWSSSNTSIATIDNTGKVTAVAVGKTTITAKYDHKISNYEINVNPSSEYEEPTLMFMDGMISPPHPLVLNEEHSFSLQLTNIPKTEKENIKVTIEDESIAKIIDIDLCEDNNKNINVKVKFLALGTMKMTATYNYNGKIYSDTYIGQVIKSKYSLILSSKDNTKLPSTLEVGNEIQVIASFGLATGNDFKDVTKDGVVWTSSDDKIATVNKGLVTTKKEGNVTITAKYTEGDYSIEEKYKLIVKNSKALNNNIANNTTKNTTNNIVNKTANNIVKNTDSTTAPSKIPNAGDRLTMVITGFILILFVIGLILFKKYKNYNDVK